MNRYSTSITLAAALGALAGPALAELRYSNASGGDVLLYGQFSPAYLSFDDGVSTTDAVVDNGNSNSRVGLLVRQPFDGLEFRFNLETALGFRQSFLVTQGFEPKGLNWQRTSIRKVDFSLTSPSWGTFSLGQGSMATDGVAGNDLSGVTLALSSSIGDTSGAFRFADEAGAVTFRTIAGAFSNFDGGRRGRVRYDTPSFNGFSLSASYGEEILVSDSELTTQDVALRYDFQNDTMELQAALGYALVDPGYGVDDFEDYIGSVSVLFNSGVNLTFGAGKRSRQGQYGYGKIGYLANWLPVGSTALAADLYQGNDRTVDGSRSDSWGVAAVQYFDDYNVEAYLAYRSYALDEPETEYRDASSLFFGARWSF